jgi:hypothetical protein
VERRTSIQTDSAIDIAIGDYNGDGIPDLAFLNSPRDEAATLWVYYRSGSGFPDARRAVFPAAQATAIRAAELNRDRFADLVVAMQGDHSLLMFGSAAGLSSSNSIRLLSSDAQDAAATDLNHDGFPDLAIANGSGPNSVIYWGSPDGFSSSRRVELPTEGASGVAIADFNRDGLPDVAFPNSHDDRGHDVPSTIYWGSPQGFASYLRSEIQGFGPTAIAAADFNGDGQPDILLMNQASGPFPNPVNALYLLG